jgi:hypothetical protein
MIPKVIWQTHENEFKDLPYPYNLNAKTWIKQNPRYIYKYVNAEERRIQLEFLRPDMLEVYDSVPSNVTKSDIWRYAVLTEYGGVYADLDSICLHSLELDHDQEFITAKIGGNAKCDRSGGNYSCDKEFHSTVNNSHFACSPKNEILQDILDTIKNNFYTAYPGGAIPNGDAHHHISDPLVYSEHLWKYDCRISPTFHFIKMDHHGSESCLDVLNQDDKEVWVCHGNFHKEKYIAVN